MSFLKHDPEQAKGGGLIEDGTYEAYIKAVKIDKVSQSGKQGTEILLVVRDDIDQPFQGSKVYDNFWDTEQAMWRYHVLTGACGAEEGQVFSEKQDLKDFILGKPVRITVEQYKYTDNKGENKTGIRVMKYELSQHQDFIPPAEEQEDTPEINEDDLPF